MDELQLNDNTNIAGMSFLIDTDNVAQDFDPQKLEKEIMSGDSNKLSTPDINKQFESELSRISKRYDTKSSPTKHLDDLLKQLDGFKPSDAPIYDGQQIQQPPQRPIRPIQPVQPAQSIYPNQRQFPHQQQVQQSDARQHYSYKTEYKDPQFASMTQEERNQAVIRGAMGQISTGAATFSVDVEKAEDEKARLLETIESLREILLEDRVDLSRIPEVNSDSSLEEIKSVLTILLLKNNRKRFTAFSEDGFMLMAHGVEYLFNGTNTYFGHTPNMTGWSRQVRNKIRRNRHETSEIVSKVMEKYGIGSGTQLTLELFGSAVLYSRMKKSEKKSHIRKKVITEDEWTKASDEIRDWDEM